MKKFTHYYERNDKMEIYENKKLLVDMENKYLFDGKDLVVILNDDNQCQILKKYTDKKYSIKARVKSSSKTETLIISNYCILEYHDSEKLKKSHRLKMLILDKVGIKSSTEGGILILGFEKIGIKNKIKYLRHELGITQEELAKKANVSRRTISSLENGDYNPSLSLANEIAKALDCSSIEEVFTLY
jgi:putative transcriptional regulator